MAARFWVGGTGNLDGSTTTHIAATSGGASGASYPGTGDTMTWDANSGGGTVTITAPHTFQALTMGAFTGTWDNSVGNHNITVTNTSSAFSITGSGTRTIRLGSATYTLSAAGAVWQATTTTNLTFVGSSANIVFAQGNGSTLNGGGLSYGSISFGASTSLAAYLISGANTFGTVTITAPNWIQFPSTVTTTISNAFNWVGTASGPIMIVSSSPTGSSAANIAAAGGSTASWCGFRTVTFTGSPTASNSLDFGQVSGISISVPASSGRRDVIINNPSLVA